MKTILYVHGMGGGGDSRIPNHLKTLLDPYGVRVIVRTYDFDPPVGHAQLASWVEEVKPDLVIGESLGAIQALRVKGIPHLFVFDTTDVFELGIKENGFVIERTGRVSRFFFTQIILNESGICLRINH